MNVNAIKIIIMLFLYLTGTNSVFVRDSNIEDKKFGLLADLVKLNLKDNGWKDIILFGHFPNGFYLNLNDLPYYYTFVTSNTNDFDYFIEDAVPYPANTILIRCFGFVDFEQSLLQVMSLPYWHPHANIFLLYHSKESNEQIARFFYIFWYYKASNVVLVQDDDDQELLRITRYSPYISDVYKIGKEYGCWTVKKIGIPIHSFDEGFACEKSCRNVTINSKLRAANLGTCLGFFTNSLSYSDRISSLSSKLFEDKGRNFHGYTFRAFTTEVLPFMLIQEISNNTYKLGSRDGTIWNNMAKILNFSIDLTPSLDVMKSPFSIETNIKQIFSVAHRKGDLFLIPIYQFAVIVVEIDYTFAFRDSGVCFMAHRADFETILFDVNSIIGYYDILVKFGLGFLCVWIIFILYTVKEINKICIDMDLIGKSFMNSVRCILLINLLHPPKSTPFRIFLAIIIWSFFIINFSTQAAITSFFTAFKRGREVDTFEDIIEKGYKIEGVATPDVVLPNTEERFQKINSKLSPLQDLFGCVKELNNDSHRFCLIDCSVGRYLERNKLNDKGQQYLHITKDRVHSYYLNFIFPRYSVISKNFDKYIMAFFEAGLIKKWEEYKFSDIKDDAPIAPLGIKDISGIFHMFMTCSCITLIIFFLELFIGSIKRTITATES